MFAKGNGKGAAFVAFLAVVLGTTACSGNAERADDMYDYGKSDGTFGADVQSKSGGWSSHGSLFVRQTDVKVTLQANFPTAEYYTVEFNVNSPVSVQAEALITWSVEGNQVTRRVFVGDGVSISGTGQGVNVSVVDATPDSAISPAGTEYKVNIQVSKGTRPSQNQPPVYIPAPVGGVRTGFGAANTIPPGSTDSYEIPFDAGAISLFVTVMPTTAGVYPEGSFIVRMEDRNGAVTFSVYDPRDFNGWVPLVPGTGRVSIQNALTPGGGVPNLDYALWIGIDG